MQGKSVRTAVWDMAVSSQIDVIALQEAASIETSGQWVAAPNGSVTCGATPVGSTATCGVMSFVKSGPAERKTRRSEASAAAKFAYVQVNWAKPSRVEALDDAVMDLEDDNPDLEHSERKTRAKVHHAELKEKLTLAEEAGTHCNMALAVRWSGAAPVVFSVSTLGGAGTSDRPALSVTVGGVTYFNVHLTSGAGGGKARTTELQALKLLAATKLQWVALGDFNQSPSHTEADLGMDTIVHTKGATHRSGGNYDYAVAHNVAIATAQLVPSLQSDHKAVFIK